jgi:hypothetical protein
MVGDVSGGIEQFLDDLSWLVSDLSTAQHYLAQHVESYPRAHQIFNPDLVDDVLLDIEESDLDAAITSLGRANGHFGSVKSWLIFNGALHAELRQHLIDSVGKQTVCKAQSLIEGIDRSEWSTFKGKLKLHRREVIRWVSPNQLTLPFDAVSPFRDGLKRDAERCSEAWRILTDAYDPMRVGEFRTGRWFQNATNGILTTDTLNKACKRGKIKGKKPGKDWTYLVDSVKENWMDYANLIDAAILKEETAGH